MTEKTLDYRKRILDFVLMISFATYVVGTAYYSFRSDPWSHAEWLITYVNGFSRRGLLGQALIYVSDLSSVSLRIIVPLAQSTVFGSLLWVIRNNYTPHKSLAGFVLLFIPGGVLWLFAEPSVVGRKDHLFILVAALWMILAFKPETSKPLLQGLAFLGAWGAVFLSHEGFASYSLALTTLALFYTRIRLGVFRLRLMTMAPVLAGVAVVLTTLTSPKLSRSELCEPLLIRGYDSQVCDGAISWAERDVEDGLSLISLRLAEGEYLPFYLLVLLVQIILVLATVASQRPSILSTWTYLYFGLALLIGLLALSAIADDWGRWISIATILFLLGHATSEKFAGELRSQRRRTFVVILTAFLVWGFSSANAEYTSPLENLMNLSYYLSGGMSGQGD